MQYEVAIKNRKQQILLLRVEDLDTVASLKKQLESKLPPAEAGETLFFNGVPLDDPEATLFEFGVVPAGQVSPVLTLGADPFAPFQLAVALPGGRRFTDLVSSTTTVAQLKAKITSEVGVPYLAIKLYHNSALLEDRAKLSEAGVAPGTLLQLKTSMPLYSSGASPQH